MNVIQLYRNGKTGKAGNSMIVNRDLLQGNGIVRNFVYGRN